MCTVTFIPGILGENSFVLTSNRDERSERHADYPQWNDLEHTRVIFPRDPDSGGTWIAASERHTLCLLNGAFEKHRHQPPYRKSRGLVLLDFFAVNNSETYADGVDLEGIEPFTLVMVEHRGLNLFELRWDGTAKHFKKLDSREAYIWSSATLYNDHLRNWREQMFRERLNEGFEHADAIVAFHSTAGSEDRQNGLVMEREGGPKTLSITSVAVSGDAAVIRYLDLLTETELEISIR